MRWGENENVSGRGGCFFYEFRVLSELEHHPRRIAMAASRQLADNAPVVVV